MHPSNGKYCILAVIGCLLAFLSTTQGFPDGAPADTCVKSRTNEPNHGAARSQSQASLPYQVTASGNAYGPGTQIQVTIHGHQDVFRGFFLQARDAQTNEWIGSWYETPNTKTIPECSSVTHADNRDKEQATFVWQAPKDRQGQVYFTGTIVKNYGTYWANVIAAVPGALGRHL
ncbi:putative defense protein 3 [Anopheles maculipalpis]|uniref:putative defense protein 3 n=1 Tax=Anopheles maculipalpis TaxID=1496333 RepID=UPI0021592C37|nr:putative defense protein 3 [Anopheles maculipalpis]